MDADTDPAAGPGAPMVEIRKLWTVFNTPERRIVVHKDLDFSVQRGEVVSIVGGSDRQDIRPGLPRALLLLFAVLRRAHFAALSPRFTTWNNSHSLGFNPSTWTAEDTRSATNRLPRARAREADSGVSISILSRVRVGCRDQAKAYLGVSLSKNAASGYWIRPLKGQYPA